MHVRPVRAMLYLKTPHGRLRKSVNWFIYETRALCTRSANAQEAMKKFLKYGADIINSSFEDLRYLALISFYEENRDENVIFCKKENQTATIQIIRSGEKVRFEVK